EGKIVSILKRGRTHLGGIVHLIDKNHEIYAFSPLLGNQKRILVKKKKGQALHMGDRIIMEVEQWGDDSQDLAICHLTKVIGNIKDPEADVPAAIAEFELRGDFPKSALKHAKSYGNSVQKADLKN